MTLHYVGYVGVQSGSERALTLRLFSWMCSSWYSGTILL